MKIKHWMFIAAVLTTGCLAQDALADDQPDSGAPATVPVGKAGKKSSSKTSKKPADKTSSSSLAPQVAPAVGDMAVPRQDNVNVRGKALLNSDVVGRLKKTDKVKVLEEITAKHPKADEPPKWLKVTLPASTPVWANTSFIDESTKAVKPNKLNLRSGPGENYSVVGRVPKGTVLKTIETKGEWTKVESPNEAYGYVAAHLLTRDAGEPVLASMPPPPNVPPPVQTAPPPVTPPPPPIITQPVTPGPTVAVAPPVTPPAPVTPPPTPAVTEPPAITKAPEPAIPAIEEPAAKRVVTREGIVKRSVSIQAPTYFVLEALNNGKAVDYLYSSSTNVS
ncbi:MAG TPA: SH3 domain-containing protein, partial [Candidatus Saccharimonadales bacterium]|nr:SH3 domain-containing protein [Candidatus Saccharimonadales bacterium]